jgi:two-component system, LytTR family, sensor kinase
MDRTYTRLRWKPLLTAIFCWALFIAYEQGTIYFASGRVTPVLQSLFYYGCNIGLFYLHGYLLNFALGQARKRYGLAVLLTLANLTIILMVKIAGDVYFLNRTGVKLSDLRQVAFWDLDRSLFFIGLATLLWSVRNLAAFQQRAGEAEKQRLTAERDRALLETRLAEAQSAYYQHQLNPHLLFNTLSFVYNDAFGHSEPAARAILLLSDILRFSLTEADSSGKAPLEEEISQLENLLEINRLRYGSQLAVSLSVEGHTAGRAIIPLILLTLAENLFKHGLVTDPARPALIRLQADEQGGLIFTTANDRKLKAVPETPRGLGIRNSRIRLDSVYPGRYSLDIIENEKTYQLELKIKL